MVNIPRTINAQILNVTFCDFITRESILIARPIIARQKPSCNGTSLIQEAHFVVNDTGQALCLPMLATVHRWPCLMSLLQSFRVCQRLREIAICVRPVRRVLDVMDILYLAVNNIFLVRQSLGELDLMVVKQLLIRHHDQRYRQP